jgi:hypothetical protein
MSSAETAETGFAAEAAAEEAEVVEAVPSAGRAADAAAAAARASDPLAFHGKFLLLRTAEVRDVQRHRKPWTGSAHRAELISRLPLRQRSSSMSSFSVPALPEGDVVGQPVEAAEVGGLDLDELCAPVVYFLNRSSKAPV